MSDNDELSFSEQWKRRVAEKAASRQKDEDDMASGRVSREEMTLRNGGGRLNVSYVGDSERMKKLAKYYD